jgi:hypothetical protein
MKKIIFCLFILCNFSIFACDYDEVDTYKIQPILQKLYGGYWRYEHDELVTNNHSYRIINTLKYDWKKRKHIVSVIEKTNHNQNYDCRSCQPDYYLMEVSLSKNDKDVKVIYNKKVDAPITEDDIENQFEVIRIKDGKHILIHQGSYSYQGITSAKISVFYNGNKILEVDPSYEGSEDDNTWYYQTMVSYDTNKGMIQFRRKGTIMDLYTKHIDTIDSVETYKFTNDKLVMVLK